MKYAALLPIFFLAVAACSPCEEAKDQYCETVRAEGIDSEAAKRQLTELGAACEDDDADNYIRTFHEVNQAAFQDSSYQDVTCIED